MAGDVRKTSDVRKKGAVMSRDRIVVTGLGLVCALGNSVEKAYERAANGKSGIRRCDELLGPESDKLPVRVAGTIEGLDVEQFVTDRHPEAFSRGTVYALAASAQAVSDAKVMDAGLDPERIGIVTGAAAPAADAYFRAARRVIEAQDATVMTKADAPQISAHAPAALIGLRHGFQGPNLALSAACATGATVLPVAADQIRAGRADVIIAGATESFIGPMAFGSFAKAGAVNPTDDPIGACRPFDLRRAGPVFGEGSGFFVIESAEHAEARGAFVYAELLGDALTNDAFHMWAPKPESWARGIAIALRRAGVAPEEIDWVSAHAPGTKLGDAAETWALKEVLGPHAYTIPVTSTKGMHGHALGAAAAIELVLALTAMHQGEVLPTTGLDERDPVCDLDYVETGTRRHPTRTLLKNAFGFGGTKASLVLRRP